MATAITTIVIMNITQTKHSPLVPTWWIALIVILLFVFGTLPFFARLMTVSDDTLASKIAKGTEIHQEQIVAYISGREAAVALFPYSGFYNDLAMVAFDGAVKDPTKAKAYLENAAYWQKFSLMASPSDPYGWFRLAYIYESTMGDKAKAAKAWHQSYISAPYEPRLLLPRLAMARRLEAYLGEEAPDLIIQLIRQAWDDNPWHLTRDARDGKYLALAREALKYDEAALTRLDKILKDQL